MKRFFSSTSNQTKDTRTDTEKKIEQKSKAIINKFKPTGVTLEPEKVKEGIKLQMEKYRFGVKEASEVYEARLYEQNQELERIENTSEYGAILVKEFNQPEMWGDVTVTVMSLWEKYDEDIQDIGLVRDMSGSIKFTLWKEADQPHLIEGSTYHITNVISKPYNDDVELKITKNSTIRELKDAQSFDRHTISNEFEGRIIDIAHSSGIITRCSKQNCTRALKNDNKCAEHGTVSGDPDLRIIATVDNGQTNCQMVFGQKHTEDILDVTLSDVNKEDREKLFEYTKDKLVGEYVSAALTEINTQTNYKYVKSFQLSPPIDRGALDQLLIKARDMRIDLG